MDYISPILMIECHAKKKFLYRFLKDLNLMSEFNHCFNIYNVKIHKHYYKNINDFIYQNNNGGLIMYAFDWTLSKFGYELWQEVFKAFANLCYESQNLCYKNRANISSFYAFYNAAIDTLKFKLCIYKKRKE